MQEGMVIYEELASKPIKMKIRLYNNIIEQLIKNSGLTIEKIVEQSGVRKGSLYNLKSMKLSPKRETGEYRTSARLLAEYFKVLPEDLFPEVIENIKKNKSELELSEEEVYQISLEIEGHKTPEELVQDTEKKEVLQHAISTLTPRQERIIKMYFYEDKTIAEIATTEGVTTERIRQIINRALRILRHPLRAKKLKEA